MEKTVYEMVEELKAKLDKSLEEETNLLSQKIIKASQELDSYIIEVIKLNCKIRIKKSSNNK